MVQRIKPQNVKVVTQDGECKLTISLDINIHLDSKGVSASLESQGGLTEKEDEVTWAIPDFDSTPVKMKGTFGKKVGE